MFGKLTDKQNEFVGYVIDSGKHLLNLINDILDLSKVEAGKVELELSQFDMRETLQGALGMFTEKAMKHGITMTLELAPDMDTAIQADERRLKQILFNLLSNAVKFTPDGGGVSLQARQSTAQEMEISVSDTGIGMKAEDMPKLFHEFSQIESAYDKNYEGTGLGLALSRKLVELHGGRIWVESDFGQGSRFTFVIPVRQGESHEA
jgi:signal transduction histidine kinase